MVAEPLINALPDLVVVVQRDGTVLDHGGGCGLPDLKLDQHSHGKRLDEVWPGAIADLIRRLARSAIANRSNADASLDEGGSRYEVRASVLGPDRVLCVLRLLPPAASSDTTQEHIRPQLDRRGFLRRFKDSIALAALRENPAAVAVIQLDGLTDVAQIIDSRIAEQLLSAAIIRLSPPPGDASGDACSWYLGQLNDNLLSLVLESADRDIIEQCLSDLCVSLSEPIAIGDATFRLTPYAGVAILGRDAKSPRALLDHARAAASHARRTGSSKVCFFTDTLQLRSLARLDIARELSQAIANRDIRLRYAGRYDLKSGRLLAWIGYLRWIHPIRGEVRPVEFLRVAETTGLATALSRAVLECVQQDFTALSSQWDSDVRISFGALRHHVMQDDFGADIERLLASGAIPAQRLELRISEQTFIARDATVLKPIARLGVQLVVDEVGRGMGSLDALARAPIWGLQLDRAWVIAARTDEVALKVCRAAINVASAFGLTSIATGVDDARQRQTLLAMGCRYGSGDLYHSEMPELLKPYRIAVSD
jgi:EAL domain-containing protein (putative c-di-GMP-specific phosphodiesterase class I)/GGDEF domain-containing protein